MRLRYGNDSQDIRPLGDETPMMAKTYRDEHHVSAKRADDRTSGVCTAHSRVSEDMTHSPPNRCHACNWPSFNDSDPQHLSTHKTTWSTRLVRVAERVRCGRLHTPFPLIRLECLPFRKLPCHAVPPQMSVRGRTAHTHLRMAGVSTGRPRPRQARKSSRLTYSSEPSG
jgi:hypothetical protein